MVRLSVACICVSIVESLELESLFWYAGTSEQFLHVQQIGFVTIIGTLTPCIEAVA